MNQRLQESINISCEPRQMKPEDNLKQEGTVYAPEKPQFINLNATRFAKVFAQNGSKI
jgi:hypothetical protein